MTITMPENLVDDGAVLVHPTKAFILRHIPLPETYQDPEFWTLDAIERANLYVSSRLYERIEAGEPTHVPQDVIDYMRRLHEAAQTLYGEMEFDLHTQRAYTAQGLTFHRDHEDELILDPDMHLVRMATCIHNVGDTDRYLFFQRPDWSNHVEEFKLPVPAGRILIMGGQLITDYTHGIPASDDASTYRSVITRFSKWRLEDDREDG